MVSHLLRIWHRQNCQRRSAMAPFHRYGRVLPKRPAAHLDRLVRRASAALVPLRQCLQHSRSRACPRLDAFLPSPRPYHLLLHRRALANRHNPHRQLHLLELPRPRPRHFSPGRPFPRPFHPAILESAANATDANSFGGIFPPENQVPNWQQIWARYLATAKLALTAVMFAWLFYSSTVLLLWMIWPAAPFPPGPVAKLQPFRIADRYGLFAVMTRGRYEIEFQGSNDAENWLAYKFRFKPQNPYEAPRIYAPYQPRFDWNLWFASLGHWRSNPIVPRTEERLLEGNSEVLALFAGNPFPQQPPR